MDRQHCKDSFYSGAGTPGAGFWGRGRTAGYGGHCNILGADSGVFKTLHDQTGNGHGLSQSQPANSLLTVPPD